MNKSVVCIVLLIGYKLEDAEDKEGDMIEKGNKEYFLVRKSRRGCCKIDE